MSALTDLTISEALDGLARKTFSAIELAEAHTAAVERARGLNAFITETPDRARAMAKASDARRAKGSAGLLDGLAATTHHMAFPELRAAAPHATVLDDARIVDNGRVILSSGVSAGIDMALYVVARLHGDDIARETARYMEYEGRWDDTARVVTPASATGRSGR